MATCTPLIFPVHLKLERIKVKTFSVTPYLFPLSGNYGNIQEPVGQPVISVTSPAISHRRKALDVPDSSDTLASSSRSPSPFSPSSPLLPRYPQDPTRTSSTKSTTPPEKPAITEGNRLRDAVSCAVGDSRIQFYFY